MNRFILLLVAVSLLAGCHLGPTPAEKSAREQLAQVGAALPKRAGGPAVIPAANAPLADFVRFGTGYHPAVWAAYHEWRGSVEAILPARSLPDPQFTFQADLSDTLMSFMPGLMFDLMAPAKRTAMGQEAATRSGIAYRRYVSAVTQVAVRIHKAWLELAYTSEAQRLYLATIQNLEQSIALASAEYSTGRGMVSLEQMVRLRNLVAEHHTHHAVFGDRLTAARSRFKSALGLTPADADPAWPQPALAATMLPAQDELWRRAEAMNPEIATMRAMVDMAVAEIDVAESARRRDFAVGAMADLRASPLMLRPVAVIKLPIWREKIAANIAAAQARRDAAAARVTAEQLGVAAELAQMLFMVREADRMIAYINDTALPNLEQLVASAEAGYQAGMGTPAMIPESRHMALNMQIERAKMLFERELAAADLVLIVAGTPPPGAPLLAETSVAFSPK